MVKFVKKNDYCCVVPILHSLLFAVRFTIFAEQFVVIESFAPNDWQKKFRTPLAVSTLAKTGWQ